MFPFYLQVKDVGDLNSWKSIVSMQLETLLKDNSVLRFLSYFNNISLTYVNVIVLLCTPVPRV